MLQSQCRKLEAQNYNLSLTAEQLSHSMGVRYQHEEIHELMIMHVVILGYKVNAQGERVKEILM